MKFFIFIILLNLLVNTSVLKADELSKSAEKLFNHYGYDDKINNYIKSLFSFGNSDKNKKITLEVYNRDYIFLVVNGLKAEPNIILDLPKETEIELSAAISNKFVVLSSQYKDIQLFKSWNAAQK